METGQDTILYEDDLQNPLIDSEILLLRVELKKAELKKEIEKVKQREKKLPLLNRLAICFKETAKDYSEWVVGNIVALEIAKRGEMTMEETQPKEQKREEEIDLLGTPKMDMELFSLSF